MKLEPTGLGPRELRLTDPSAEVAELSRQVEEDGGEVLAAYREPLGGHALRTYSLSPPGERVRVRGLNSRAPAPDPGPASGEPEARGRSFKASAA